MSAPNSISPEKLARLVALPTAPGILDVRERPAAAIPGSVFDPRLAGPDSAPAVIVDETGGTAAAARAAILRGNGVPAAVLDGGFAAWAAADLPTIVLTHVPPRRADGSTWWVTRARPKVDRIACPWLIRRFVDPAARRRGTAPGEVLAVAAQEQAEPFDVADDGVFWSHRADRCTFDIMVDAFGLTSHAPLARLAPIVRGADTDRLDLAPEAAGLLAVSLGLSRSHSDDHAQLDAGMALYDALYRWCRDAQDEKHDGTSHQPPRSRAAGTSA